MVTTRVCKFQHRGVKESMKELAALLKPLRKLETKISKARREVDHAKGGIDCYSKVDSDALGLPEKLAESSKLLAELQAQHAEGLREFRDAARAKFRESSPEEQKKMISAFPVVDFPKSTPAE